MTYEPEKTPGLLPTITAYQRLSSVDSAGVGSAPERQIQSCRRFRHGKYTPGRVEGSSVGEAEGVGVTLTPNSASQSVDAELTDIASLSCIVG